MAEEKTAPTKAPNEEPQAEAKAEKPAAAKAPAKKASSKKPASKAPVPKGEPKHGKRYKELAAKVEVGKAYPADEAVKLVKETATVKFDATVEIHFKLGLDPRNAEENIRGTVKLPAGTGKQRTVMAFVPEAQHAAVKKAGADFVSDEATLKKLQGGWDEFDVALATPDQMLEVAKLGKVLGPKGLMPNPKAGTVTDKPTEVIGELKKGTIEYRLAKDSTVHAGIGKASFSEADLLTNLKAYFQAISSAKPDGLKGTFVKSVTLASTMGPGIKLDPDSLGKQANQAA